MWDRERGKREKNTGERERERKKRAREKELKRDKERKRDRYTRRERRREIGREKDKNKKNEREIGNERKSECSLVSLCEREEWESCKTMLGHKKSFKKSLCYNENVVWILTGYQKNKKITFLLII